MKRLFSKVLILVLLLQISCKQKQQSISPTIGIGYNNQLQSNLSTMNYTCTVQICPKVQINLQLLNGLYDPSNGALYAIQNKESGWQYKATNEQDPGRVIAVFSPQLPTEATSEVLNSTSGLGFSNEILIRYQSSQLTQGVIKLIARDMTLCAQRNAGNKAPCLDFSAVNHQEWDEIHEKPFVVTTDPAIEMANLEKKEKQKKFMGTLLQIGGTFIPFLGGLFNK